MWHYVVMWISVVLIGCKTMGTSGCLDLYLPVNYANTWCKCTIIRQDHATIANCSSLGWTYVDLRCIPCYADVLLLDSNRINSLTNGSFSTLTNLKHLSMRASRLHLIEADGFQGLDKLEILNLEDNHLDYEFQEDVFKPFRNLKELYLAKNDGRSVSNFYEFLNTNNLSNLTHLSLDGARELNLSDEFKNLTRLANLTVHCDKVTTVTDKSFHGLWNSSLKSLSLVHCKKLKVDPNQFKPSSNFSEVAFQNMESLEHLKIDHCLIGNVKMAKMFKNFVNSSLRSVHLSKTHFYTDFNEPNVTLHDGVLTKNIMKYLSQINLTYFSWTDSNIYAIAPGVLFSMSWKHSMKKINLSKNSFGYLGWLHPLLEISLYDNLEEVVLSSADMNHDQIYPPLKYFHNTQSFLSSHLTSTDQPNEMSKVQNSLMTIKSNLHKPWLITDDSGSMLNDVLKPKENKSNCNQTTINHSVNNLQLTNNMIVNSSLDSDLPQEHRNSGTLTIKMPLSLRVIRVVNLFMHGKTDYGNASVKFYQSDGEAGNLTHFYFRGNTPIEGTGRILGLTKLQLFDLSECNILFEHYFFDDFPSLRFLILQSMRPENFFTRLSIDRLIYNLPELRYLDLADNNLNFLPSNLFSRNPHISHLILSKNRFTRLPIEVSLVNSLEVLDLTGNVIQFLDNEDMASLTQHSKKVQDFTLHLDENNIACVCSQLKFLFWLNVSEFLSNKGNYSCTSEEGSLITTDVLLRDLLGFFRMCYGYNYFLLSVMLFFGTSLSFLAAHLFHRFRNHIEAFIIRLFVKEFRHLTAKDYKTHVFIGYADDDVWFVRHILLKYLEQELKVSCFVHHRDQDAGYTDQQMFDAINSSWRILLVITERFLKNYDLADIVMKYASHSVTLANQDRVVILVHQTQVHSIPDYLYEVIDDSKIIFITDLTSDLDYVQKQKIKENIRSIH